MISVGVQVLKDVVRKVEGHDVAVAARSGDPNLGVAVCGRGGGVVAGCGWRRD